MTFLSIRHRPLTGMILLACLWANSPAVGERIILKDGTTLSGRVDLDGQKLTVRTDMRTVTTSAAMLLRPEPDDFSAEPTETYPLNSNLRKGRRRIVAMRGINAIEPFDRFGRRTVTIEGMDRRTIDVHQAITEIHPDRVLVEGINYGLETVLRLDEVPTESLLSILDQLTPPAEPPAQLKRASFLVQANLYGPAHDAIEAIKRDFPDLASRAEKLDADRLARFRREALSAAERYVAVGLDQQAETIHAEVVRVGVLPSDAAAWADLKSRIDERRRQIRAARTLIHRWLDSGSPADLDAPIARLAIQAHDLVGPASIDRLRPMLTSATGLDASSGLAMAASGWAAGANLATTEQAIAEKLARAREQIERALAADDDDTFDAAVRALEALPIKPDLATTLLPLLTAPSTDVPLGEPIQIPARDDSSSPYTIRLPTGYDRCGQHPLIVALHGIRSTIDDQIQFWTPIAERWNAIVVAPEYLLAEDQAYEYSLDEHYRFLKLLSDLRREHAIDANRVFLTGHELGAYAAFDLGMSHPDEFAGLVTIGGLPKFYGDYYWPNTEHLPVYYVAGLLDGGNSEAWQEHLDRVVRKGFPTISVEYLGRGGGPFEVERSAIWDWMSRQQRTPFPPVFEAVSARHSDRRFYWVEADQYLPSATIPPKLFDRKKRLKPAHISTTRPRANELSLQVTGLSSIRLHLTPELISIDGAPATIKVNGKVVHDSAIEGDLATLLREVRRTGDRLRPVVRILDVTW